MVISNKCQQTYCKLSETETLSENIESWTLCNAIYCLYAFYLKRENEKKRISGYKEVIFVNRVKLFNCMSHGSFINHGVIRLELIIAKEE